jgi:hypothetical protein
MQIIRLQPPSVRFWADDQTVPRGNCTWLHWDVEHVREVYLDGEGVIGHDQRELCPTSTTVHELKVVHMDGTVALHPIEIVVTTP